MHYLLYRITNKVNNKIYVGVHKTKSLDDGYMGSGKVIRAAILKHGAENFHKEILETFDDAASMYEREKQFVDEAFLNRDDTYNLRRGGTGGFDYINSTIDLKERNRKINSNRTYEEPGFRDLQSSKTKAWRAANPNDRVSSLSRPEIRNLGNSAEARQKAVSSQRVTFSKIDHQKGSKNSQFGTFWITNGIEAKKHIGDIPEGWSRGRKINARVF